MKVNTVKGQIQSDDLGITLSHEHILFSYNFFFYESPLNSLKKYAYKNVEMEDIHILKVNPYISQDNLNLSDIDDAIKEVNFFKRAGGSTLVSVTPPGLGRDDKSFVRLSHQNNQCQYNFIHRMVFCSITSTLSKKTNI